MTVDEVKQRAEFYGLGIVVVETGQDHYFNLVEPGSDGPYLARGSLETVNSGITEAFKDNGNG